MGEIRIISAADARQLGLLSGLQAELGAVIAGDDPGRTSSAEITVFDSTGIALQDLSSAAMILRRAKETGRGQSVLL